MELSSPDSQLMKQSQLVASQKNSNWFFIFVLIILAFLAGMGVIYAWQNYPDFELFNPLKLLIKPQTEKACTMDAKICPDGSSVGRVPPDCDFAPCPIVEPLVSSQPTIEPSPLQTIKPSIDEEEKKKECLQKGGEWETDWLKSGSGRCFLKMKDVNKDCLSSKDCEGECLAPEGTKPGEKVIGKCSQYEPTLGCHSRVENGKVEPILCVD